MTRTRLRQEAEALVAERGGRLTKADWVGLLRRLAGMNACHGDRFISAYALDVVEGRLVATTTVEALNPRDGRIPKPPRGHVV